MISSSSPHDVHTLIGSSSVSWQFADGFKLQAISASLGSPMPMSPATYLLCAFDGSNVRALYVGATRNLYGRLNIDLSWHPHISELISSGAHVVAFVPAENFADCVSLQQRLVADLNPSFRPSNMWPGRRTAT